MDRKQHKNISERKENKQKAINNKLNQTSTTQSRVFSLEELIKTVEISLFQLAIFLIPTNLWFALDKNSASVNGIIVDYLIPKIYLSDLVLVMMLVISLGKNLVFQRLHIRTAKLIPYLICLIPLLVSGMQSYNSLASHWFLVKIIEMALVVVWMNHTKPSLRVITTPLLLGITFESVIGLVQWLQKSSVLGYVFFGETNLKITANIAKTSLGGQLRPLPYGTTPHPNILAGFIAIGLLVLLTIRTHWPKPTSSGWLDFVKTSTTLVFLALSLITLLLTQSITAILALVIGVILIRGRYFHPMNLVSMVVILGALTLFVFPILDQESITRRLELTQISLAMIANKPLLGVGLNNFTAVMPNYGQVIGPSRFLQPVHNIYLLWIAETGLAGTLPILWLCWDRSKQIWKTIHKHWNLLVPLICLLLIGLLDHYPLTLQTGQLLCVVTFGLVVMRNSDINKK